MKIQFKAIFIKTFLLILSTSFILFGIINFFTGIGDTNILKIGKEKISILSFNTFLTQKRNKLYNENLTDNEINYINSSDFISITMKEFVEENLLKYETKILNLTQEKNSVAQEIIKQKDYQDSNGNFDIKKYKKLLKDANITEDEYIDFISSHNTRFGLIELLKIPSLTNNFILKKINNYYNNYTTIDLISINKDDIIQTNIKIDENDIENYYKKNQDFFIIPEEKIISYLEINFSKFKNEEAINELSKLEDLILTSNNIDEISKIYKVKKKTMIYSENNQELAEDITFEFLQSNEGTFSDLIYKDNNVYKIFYIEKINNSKQLSLQDAKKEIIEILTKSEKSKNNVIVLEKMIKQMQTYNINDIATRNGAKILKNQNIYRNNIEFPEDFIEKIFILNKENKFSKPFFDVENNRYLIAYFKNSRKIKEDEDNYLSIDSLNRNINIMTNNTVFRAYQNYLFNKEKIIINNKLYSTLLQND